MSLFHKNLSEITFKDIEDLLSNNVIESMTMDYKQDLIPTLKKDDERTKINILKDIVAFANSKGGDLIIGVSERSGIPEKITGMDIAKVDELKRTIESIMGQWVDPRISKYEFNNPISLPSNSEKAILILRIHKSFNTPHMLMHTKENRFWYRLSSKNEVMNLQQIKSAIDFSQSVESRIKRFLMDRINVIESDEIPYPLLEKAKTVIHFIPISSFLENEAVDLKLINNQNEAIYTGIGFVRNGNFQYNADGLVKGSFVADDLYSSYVQYFRNGVIESVDNHFLISKEAEGYTGLLSIRQYEKELSQEIVPKFLSLMNKSGLSMPVWVVITLVNVKGFKPHFETYRTLVSKNDRIKKDVLRLPFAIFESYEDDIFLRMGPIFNFLWNLAGYEKSNSFDDNGKFKG